MITRRGLLSGAASGALVAAWSPAALANAVLAEGSAVPDVQLAWLDGKRFSLAAHLHGKVGLLSFWATWCGPCLEELPSLNRLHAKLAAEPGVRILAVNVDQGFGAAMLEGFWKRNGLTLPSALDVTGQASRLFRVAMLPMAYLVSNQGKVRYALPGARSWESDQWARGLLAMTREGQGAG